ncbi:MULTISPECIES: TetR/AcrR family transcriptional regulator [unclassified Mycobacterium]|uniref:TetR/AcrR family transcriptional regulator n=1 Tax=unclassified Mycobacterium TaxID=2642494 RepID=UPI0029C646C6|nr:MULTISPECIES: TetR/AcrR family transcriptional regulator [unclassified Mycobacterium]
MTSPTRWAGVPLSDRRTERRARLVEAAFTLFGRDGESAVTVRSVCRVTELNSRYFYESFANTDELLGAVYDHVALQLGEFVGEAMMAAAEDRRAQTWAGIRAVLWFSAADPRRGRVLFTDAHANSVLAERRSAAEDLLFQMVVEDDERFNADADPVSARVAAALYTGAMTELVHQWLAGRLGTDLDSVVDYSMARILPDI